MLYEDKDVALNVNGATISFASSTYRDFQEPLNMIDGQRNTFWATSGLYPQQFTLSFPSLVSVHKIKIRSYLVRTIKVEKSESSKPQEFYTLCVKEFEFSDVQHQIYPLYEGNLLACHIRFTILSGYDHICAVYRVEVYGSAPEHETVEEESLTYQYNSAAVSESGRHSPHKWQLPSSPRIPNLAETQHNYSEEHLTESSGKSDDLVMPFKAVGSRASSPQLSQHQPSGDSTFQSPSTLSLLSTAEVARPPTAQRSAARRSSPKQTHLEIFTESDELSSGEN